SHRSDPLHGRDNRGHRRRPQRNGARSGLRSAAPKNPSPQSDDFWSFAGFGPWRDGSLSPDGFGSTAASRNGYPLQYGNRRAAHLVSSLFYQRIQNRGGGWYRRQVPGPEELRPGCGFWK